MKIFLVLMAVLFTQLSFAQKHDHSTHSHKTDTAKKKASAKKPAQSAPAIKKDTIKKTEVKAPVDEHDHTAHDHGTPKKSDTTALEMDDHSDHEHGSDNAHDHGDEGAHAHDDMSMTHSFSLSLPMNRNGSGTAWLPDNSPVYGYMYHKRNWMLMLHGNLFLRYNSQDFLNKGSRGNSQFDAPSWGMLMAEKRTGSRGLLRFSGMMSLDPLITGGKGYPLLFQTGETHKGEPLVDRQHPHDFISELSVGYTYAPSATTDVFLYVGWPGEPAIGPVAFMHRPSALNNPDATLTHHWTDATHITFGVATVGLRWNNFKIEGSSFTGREPDENRFNFDRPRFDSWSGRLSYNPSEKWAMQVSHGFLKEPEPLHPGEDVSRTTASVIYSSRDLLESFFNASAVWGVNRRGHHGGENGLLVEAAYTKKKFTPYMRYEWVEKSSEELQIEDSHGHNSVFNIHAFTAGLNHDLLQLGNTRVALGGHLTFFNPNNKLASIYGQNPIAAQVYLRMYPSLIGKKVYPFFIEQ